MIKTEIFSIASRDGKTQLYAKKWIPQNQPRGIVQIVHGMNDYVDRYEKLAKYLAQRDILVVGDDHLGHGHTAQKDGSFGYFCKSDAATVLVRDEHRLKKTIQSEYPDIPYIILGHSMGSFITRNYIETYGSGISGAILAGTGNPSSFNLFRGKLTAGFLSKVRGDKYVSPMIERVSNEEYMSSIENPVTKHDFISCDEEFNRAYEKDPWCTGFVFSVNAFYALFELASRMQKKENVKKIPKKLPILIVSGANDPVGEFGKAPKDLYDEYLLFDITKVTLKLYEGSRHEFFNEKNKEDVYADLYNWIDNLISFEQIHKSKS